MSWQTWIAVGVVLATVVVLALRRSGHFETRVGLAEGLAFIEQYLESRRTLEALVLAKKLVRDHPDQPRAHVALARTFIARGDRAAASGKLDYVLQRWPEH